MSEAERVPNSMSITVLGGFAVRVGERIVLDESWSRRKAKELLKRLAVQDGHTLHRERLMDDLWPQLTAEAAANNLYKNLHYLRAALGEHLPAGLMISVAEERVALASWATVDADTFRARAEHARRVHDDPELYEQALAQYTGALLPDDPYEEWAEQPREELRLLHVQLLLELGARYEAVGREEHAIERLHLAVRADPTQEEAHRALIRLYARTGRRHQALRQYHICRAALERGLGIGPAPETQALYQQVVAGELSAATRTAAADPHGEKVPVRRPLFGRERELAELEPLIGHLLAGRGQAIVISGPPGIGKSSLADHIAWRAEDRGALALTGRCYEMEAAIALQPVRQLVEQALVRVEGGRLRAVVNRSLYLGRLLSPTETPTLVADPEVLQALLFAEIAELLCAAAEIAPLVLRFEDLHAADEASLRLFHYLRRQISDRRVLVIATLRAAEADATPLVAQMLVSLRREGLVHALTLDPLSEPALQQLIGRLFEGQMVGQEVADLLTRQAEGNPFFAAELARTLVDEGWVALDDGGWRLARTGGVPVPEAVLDLLNRRTQRLSECARRILPLIAVLGRDFKYATLRHVAEQPEIETLDALEEVIGAGLLEETATGYRFCHNLIREAVYGGLTRARRQQAHRVVASTLETRRHEMEADAEEIGYHFAASDVPWRAVPYLEEAARRAAAVFAGQQAVALYEEAATLARRYPAFVEGGQLVRLLEEAGDLLTRMGETARALALHRDALTILSELGDSEGVVRTRAKVALGDVVTGNIGEATDLLQRTFQEVSAQAPSVGTAWVYYVLAQLRWHTSRNHEALEAAERAVEAAEASGDVQQRAHAYEAMALACHSLGDWQRGIKYELQRQALAASGYDVNLALDAHLCLWEYHLSGDQPYSEVERMVRQALARATAVGNQRAMAVCYQALGSVQFVQGDLAASQESLRQGVELARTAGSTYGEIIGSQQLALAETALGEVEQAHQRLRDALRLVEVTENPYIQAHARARVLAALTRNRHQAGDLPRAREYMAQALAAQARFGECVSCDTLLYPAAVPVQLAAGELDAAEETCRRAETAAAAFRSQARMATARYLRGLVAAARGDRPAARGHLEAAVATFERLGQPLDAARCREALAEVNSQAGSADTRAKALAERPGQPAGAVEAGKATGNCLGRLALEA